jgi:alginate O-acetyltransferase complex protein AlgJ
MSGRLFDAATVALFLGALAAPGIDELRRPDAARDPTPELRRASPRPGAPASLPDLELWPARFEAYHADTFGLRDAILRDRNRLYLFGLGIAPSTRLVLGRDGWIFYAGDVTDLRGLMPFEKSRLDTWIEWLETNRKRVALHGARYVYVVAPNKETIYPELVPERFNVVGRTRLDELLAAARARTSVEIVDVREAVRAEKAFDRGGGAGDYAYFQRGTHWTRRGAWAACGVILECLRASFPAVAPRAHEDHALVELPPAEDDSWARGMYVADLLAFPVWDFLPAPRRAPALGVVFTDRGDRVTSIDDARLPSVLLVHDSFGPFLQPHLAEHCRKLRCTWQYAIPEDVVEREKPDVVIQMYVERELANDPLPLPTGIERVERATFDRLPNVDWTLDPRGAGLQPLGGLRLEPADDELGHGVALVCDGAGKTSVGRVVISGVAVPRGVWPVVHLSVTCPEETAFEIWYTTRASPEFSRKNGAVLPLQPGVNDLVFALRAQDFGGGICLRPGSHGGRFVLHALEIRH